MNTEKKKYLSKYLLQNAKISRLNQLILAEPKKRKQYSNEIWEAVELREEIERKIREIDDDLLSELLFQKYICGRTLYEISLLLNYSTRQIERLHIKALEKFKL